MGVRNFAARPPADWRHILDQARAADDAGIDRVFVADHLAFGRDLSAYGRPESGGVVGGVQPTGPNGDWLEPLTALAAMAAVTNRVRLGTNVLVASLRRPVVLAKVASTLDALSHGRFELGVGVGWQQAEYRAVGVDFADRGRVLDETLAACRELWTAREATFEGRDVSFSELQMMPKPVDPAGVPVWIGGRAIPAVARRLARYGTGWLPWGATTANFAELLERMRSLVEAAGGDFASIEVAYAVPTVVTPAGKLDFKRMLGTVPELRRQGVRDFRMMVRVPHDYSAARELLEDTREHFLQACT